MKKKPGTEPTKHFHGAGWPAMLKQAQHLEANPDATHVLVQLDADTGEPGEPLIVDNRDDVLLLAKLLREKAQALRNARN
jgi:hypothetical protein